MCCSARFSVYFESTDDHLYNFSRFLACFTVDSRIHREFVHFEEQNH
jgi:hypothetical protein